MKIFYLSMLAVTFAALANPNEEELVSPADRMDVDAPRVVEKGVKRKSDDASEPYTSESYQPRKTVKVMRAASAPAAVPATHEPKVCAEITDSEWQFPDEIGGEKYEEIISSIVTNATETDARDWQFRDMRQGYLFLQYKDNAGFVCGDVRPGMTVAMYQRILGLMRPGEGEERETKLAKKRFNDSDKNAYKIHILVSPQHMKWTLQEFVKILKANGNLNYTFKILSKSPEELKEYKGYRTLPTIVLYIPNAGIYQEETYDYLPNPNARPENIQKLFDAFYSKFQHCTKLDTGTKLRHNCGGPVVWIAGGDADLKPGGAKYYLAKGLWGAKSVEDNEGDSSTLPIYRQIGQVNGFNNYPYFVGQTPIKVHSGVCYNVTG